MIGLIITGRDLMGQDCEGQVLDKVLTLQSIQMRAPGPAGALEIGRAQNIPIPLDAYLVLSEDNSIHLVAPQFITGIADPVNEPAPDFYTRGK